MTRFLSAVSVAAVLTAIMVVPASTRGQQANTANQHKEHQSTAPRGPSETGMMAGRQASDAEFKVLVQKMNDTQGPEKVEAMAALLNALVERQQAMCANMPGMMGHGKMGDGGTPATTPK